MLYYCTYLIYLFNTKENDVSYYKTQICLIKVLYAKSR